MNNSLSRPNRVLLVEYYPFNSKSVIKVGGAIWLWGILFFIDYVLSHFINTDLLTIVCWFSFVLYTVLYHTRFVIKYFMHYYEYITHVIGVFVIENSNVALGELGTYSSRHNSFFFITFIHWLLISVLLLIDPIVEKIFLNEIKKREILFRGNRLTHTITKCIGYLVLAVTSYLLLRALQRPAFLMGIDRAIYMRDYVYASPVWALLHGFMVYGISVTLLIIVKGHKKLGFGVLGLYCLYMFFVGNKFGTYISILFLFVPYIIDRFDLNHINRKKVIRILLLAVLISVGFLALVFFFNIITYGRDIEEFLDYLNRRVAQQGQLWWAVYGREKGSGIRLDELGDEFGSFFDFDRSIIDGKKYGIYKIMQYVTPASIYAYKISINGRYAFSTDASFYYYFKEAMIIFVPIGALLVSISVNWLYRAVRMQDLINIVVAARFQTIVVQVMVQSDFNKLFSRQFSLLLSCCIIWNVISRLYEKSRI